MRKLYCIPQLYMLNEYIRFSDEYKAAFEYNDFCNPDILDNYGKLKKIIKAYKTCGRDTSLDTLHGAFLDICVNSGDSKIREASWDRVNQCMEAGKELGVRAVIFHTNFIPNFYQDAYRTDWIVKNEAFWRNILKSYDGVEIYMENMFDEEPELVMELAKRLEDEPRFGVCLDTAHAYISHTPFQWWGRELNPFIRHLHINDNHKKVDEHKPIGAGTFPWKEYQDMINKLPCEPSVLIEVDTWEALEQSIKYMKQNRLYPFDKTY